MKLKKSERQENLKKMIEEEPFITDEELSKRFKVSIQTIRLDRLELAIPELRERIKYVAKQQWDETVKALPIDEVIGDIVDLQLDLSAISLLEIGTEHVFSRNQIARGHHLFAQANSLAVAVINDQLALTANSEISFNRPVKLGERVIAKAKVISTEENHRTVVTVESSVQQEIVFSGTFYMYRSTDEERGDSSNENRN
ncbi:transcription factor FapR [Halalkalibacillus halophilus]|uniref:transcription factor FapR n=1 Tax=Halalkalibacillus halophilus TaxID=392827 RepID=UPI0003F68809|nr:transcription factor FapR [Halalkalibacillus halophilus]